MMNSFPQSDSRRRRRRLFAATVLVIFLFVADLVSGGKLRALVRESASVAWQSVSRVGQAVGQSGFFSSRAALAHENAALQATIAHLQDRAAAYSAVEAENAQLRALVHLSAAAPGITAPVTSSFRASPYGTFTIGAGSADGIQKGALVLTPDGFAIGRISDVAAHQSLVVGLFAPGETLDVVINGIPMSLHGEGGGQATGEAPRASAISVGDPVFAPSLGGKSVGIVGNVQGSQASASTKLFVRVPVNLASLLYIYVETTH